MTKHTYTHRRFTRNFLLSHHFSQVSKQKKIESSSYIQFHFATHNTTYTQSTKKINSFEMLFRDMNEISIHIWIPMLDSLEAYYVSLRFLTIGNWLLATNAGANNNTISQMANSNHLQFDSRSRISFITTTEQFLWSLLYCNILSKCLFNFFFFCRRILWVGSVILNFFFRVDRHMCDVEM